MSQGTSATLIRPTTTDNFQKRKALVEVQKITTF